MNIRRNPSSNKTQNSNSKFSNYKKQTKEKDLDLNEILNQEIEEERNLLKINIGNINRITHISKVIFFKSAYNN